MHDFVYVTRAEAKPVSDELYEIIYEVQDIVRDDFTFQFRSVGSSSRNMITYDRKSNIGFDFDFALVYNCGNGKQQYIRFNKKSKNYTWEYQGKGFGNLEKKIKWLKYNGFWGDLQNYYIDKKNRNNNPDKHSRSILAESVNEMYQKKSR